MTRVLDVCMTYAQNFSLHSSNLILMGGTGLGKTHLSLAIANTAIAKGFGVVYSSVNNIVAKLEREHFGREEENDTSSLLLDCDLLILDDLGTEFRTAFSVAEIYNIVNTRQMAQRPTIISTNLTMKEIEERYTERFARASWAAMCVYRSAGGMFAYKSGCAPQTKATADPSSKDGPLFFHRPRQYRL